MSDFWENARSSFNKMVNKTNKAIDAGRLQFDITQYKNKISAAQRDIGRYVEEQAKAGAASVNLSDEQIDGKLKDIAFFEQKIEELREESRRILNNKG